MHGHGTTTSTAAYFIFPKQTYSLVVKDIDFVWATPHDVQSNAQPHLLWHDIMLAASVPWLPVHLIKAVRNLHDMLTKTLEISASIIPCIHSPHPHIS
jgi:hypothetical protein